MDTIRVCKQCRQQLPENAPEGLCPACLAKVALGTEPAAPGATINVNPLAEAAPPTRVAPDPAQLAAQFPQLEIIELLGMGGMGMVYKARQPRLDRIVALKILPVESQQHPSFAERFNREAKALAKLNHPGIVNVYDFGQTAQYYFFIMEFVDGMNLRQLLNTEKVAPRQALELVVQICTALQYAHDEGVVHRDIKPENILLNKKGQVKIADFGLAKLLGAAPDTALTMSQAAMGTLNYMAPEQRQNAQAVDHRADIYSLGVVFYEMLTGEVPMGRFEAPSKRVQVDVRLDEVVLRALEREPARRYQQVSEVKSNVENITATPPPPAALGTPPSNPSEPPVASQPIFHGQRKSGKQKWYQMGKRGWLGVLLCLFAFQDFHLLMGPGSGMVDQQGLHSWIFDLGFLALACGFVLWGRAAWRRKSITPREIRLARERGLWPPLGEQPSLEHVKRMVQAGEKILAIKLYREIHNASYAEAKTAVERLAGDTSPPQNAKAPTASASIGQPASAPANLTTRKQPASSTTWIVYFVVEMVLTLGLGVFLLQIVPAVGFVWIVVVFLVASYQLNSRKEINDARESGLWPQPGELPTLENVKRLARAGKGRLAIKLYRQIHGGSRADAKEAVEKLASEAKSTAEPPSSKTPKAAAVPPQTTDSQRRPGFLASLLKPSRLWALAVVVGAVTGFAPEWAYTTRYWGVWASDDANSPVQVLKVASDSPAEQTGFRVGDIVKEPTNFASFSKSWDRVKEGEKQTFTVRRNGQDVVLEASAGQNQIAVVWYANLWYPIAGALFILAGIIVFVTAPVAPPPLWRSVLVAIAGLGIAIGFAIAVAGDAVFPRFAVFERWIFVPTKNDWCGLQGLFGMAAAVLVAILGAAEIRQRLRKPPQQSGSGT